MLHEHVVPVPLNIRRRNPQQRRPSSEDFLEALEAKRNGIIRNGDQVPVWIGLDLYWIPVWTDFLGINAFFNNLGTSATNTRPMPVVALPA
jgi:hypothetical protein